jgi:septum formation protein
MHIAEQHVGAVVIGSDQVGQCGPHLLSKPGTAAAAIRSLQSTNGQLATFYTAVSLVRISADGKAQSTSDVCVTELKFRQLTDAQIAQYVDQDQPLDAAGAIKAESLGIVLFEFIRADDPSALIGLPLITVATRLQQFGLDPLNPPVP